LLAESNDRVLAGATPMGLRGYDEFISDSQIETVDGVGHWIAEQRPELVLDRLRSFLRET
jgi:pimeloyl-ACP methyl ester carboxylesterase